MAKGKMTAEGWRCEKEQEHLYRPKWVDFQDPAIHLLTLVTTKRQPLLGTLVGEQIVLTSLGQSVAEEIERIPTYKGANSIEIYRYVIMPDHIHTLLRIHERLPKHLGQYVRWFKRQCSMLAGKEQELGGVTPRGGHQGEAMLAGVTVRSEQQGEGQELAGITARGGQPIEGKIGETLFAAEYHTRTLSGRGQLNHMARYIQENPRRAALKRANPDLFRIRQDIRLGRTPCVALGNIFLADYPIREALKCSRKLSQEEIDAKREECLVKAANGTVFISGAISEGEKQICRALREAGYPLVILLTEGFPEPDSPHYRYFKPKGVYFEACAAGKLLLVEPSKEILERADIKAKVTSKAGDIPHKSQRYRFLAMNAIAEEIAEGEAESSPERQGSPV